VQIAAVAAAPALNLEIWAQSRHDVRGRVKTRAMEGAAHRANAGPHQEGGKLGPCGGVPRSRDGAAWAQHKGVWMVERATGPAAEAAIQSGRRRAGRQRFPAEQRRGGAQRGLEKSKATFALAGSSPGRDTAFVPVRVARPWSPAPAISSFTAERSSWQAGAKQRLDASASLGGNAHPLKRVNLPTRQRNALGAALGGGRSGRSTCTRVLPEDKEE